MHITLSKSVLAACRVQAFGFQRGPYEHLLGAEHCQHFVSFASFGPKPADFPLLPAYQDLLRGREQIERTYQNLENGRKPCLGCLRPSCQEFDFLGFLASIISKEG